MMQDLQNCLVSLICRIKIKNFLKILCRFEIICLADIHWEPRAIVIMIKDTQPFRLATLHIKLETIPTITTFIV